MKDNSFTLNTNLIPALRSNGIRFQYVNSVFDPMEIVVIHNNTYRKNLDYNEICRVKAIQDTCTPYSYEVRWFRYTDSIRFCNNYKHYTELIDDIKTAIESISETNELYYIGGRHIGKSYSWRNEYQKERDKFDIKDVIFNDPATIVLWADGTKTVVKAENEPFDPEKGLAMAIAKKALGNSYDYYDTFKKYVGRYEKKQKKGGK